MPGTAKSIALFGPSGVGKSLLYRRMVGAWTPEHDYHQEHYSDNGSVFFLGPETVGTKKINGHRIRLIDIPATCRVHKPQADEMAINFHGVLATADVCVLVVDESDFLQWPVETDKYDYFLQVIHELAVDKVLAIFANSTNQEIKQYISTWFDRKMDGQRGFFVDVFDFQLKEKAQNFFCNMLAGVIFEEITVFIQENFCFGVSDDALPQHDLYDRLQSLTVQQLIILYEQVQKALTDESSPLRNLCLERGGWSFFSEESYGKTKRYEMVSDAIAIAIVNAVYASETEESFCENVLARVDEIILTQHNRYGTIFQVNVKDSPAKHRYQTLMQERQAKNVAALQ